MLRRLREQARSHSWIGWGQLENDWVVDRHRQQGWLPQLEWVHSVGEWLDVGPLSLASQLPQLNWVGPVR
jgi:hypothetical protein